MTNRQRLQHKHDELMSTAKTVSECALIGQLATLLDESAPAHWRTTAENSIRESGYGYLLGEGMLDDLDAAALGDI